MIIAHHNRVFKRKTPPMRQNCHMNPTCTRQSDFCVQNYRNMMQPPASPLNSLAITPPLVQEIVISKTVSAVPVNV